MKKFFELMLTFKFIVSFLALLALLLIWVWGDGLGLPSRDKRFIASMVVFSVWVLLLLVGHLLGRSARQTWRNWAEQRQQAAQALPVTQEDPSYAFLRTRLLNAIHTLKTSSLGRRWLPFGGNPIYRMPWVVMLGQGGAGRTSLMTGSDLEYALLEYSPYQENRDASYNGCEWNFANQAVILDTHGRLAESSEGRGEWRNLLSLLKKHRSKKPLDALVLTVNVAELALADAPSIDNLAKQVRDRVHDLADHIGFQVPVYLAFTQIDRLEGFESFFRGANANELKKPWGAMLSWKKRNKQHAAQAFNAEFDLLASELREMAEQRLLQQRGAGERLGLYSFPIEFSKLKPALSSFVGKLFQTNPYQFRPLFRGFYFTSVAQSGNLVSPAGTQIREAFGIPDGGTRPNTHSGPARPFFVNEFFSSLVLPDRGLALRLPWRLERWQKWMLSITLLLTVLAALCLGLSWYNNRSAQQSLDHRMSQLSESLAESQDPRDWLMQLDALRGEAQALDTHQTLSPLSWRFGLYHGDSSRAAARQAFFGQFQQQLIQPVGHWLEAELSALNLPDAATLAQQKSQGKLAAAQNAATAAASNNAAQALAKGQAPNLRASGMAALRGGAASLKAPVSNDEDPIEESYALFKVYSALAEPARAELPLMSKRLPDLWQRAVASHLGKKKTLSANEQTALQRCIAYYLAELKAADAPRYQARDAVLGKARDTLKNLVTEMSPVRRLYKSILAQAQSFPAITLAGALGEPSDLLHGNARVSGSFTKQAWEKFFKAAFEEASKKELISDNLLQQDESREESKTLAAAAAPTASAGEPSEAAHAASQKVFDELKGLYIDDYAQAWRSFLAQIEVTPFASPDAAVVGLARLGDLRSSPYVALVQTLDEQTSWDAPTKPIFEEIAGHAQGLKDKLLGNEPQKQRVQKGEQVVGRGRLESMFMPLVSLVRSPDKGGQINQSLGRYLEQLQAVRNRLAKIRTGSAQGGAAVTLVKNTLDGVGSEINDAFVWTDQLLSGMDYKTQDAVRNLFMQPILSSWDAVLNPAAVEINSAWNNAVLEPWTQAFAGRYPFVDSTQDASMLELAKFVRDKDGVVWSFMRQNFDFLVIKQGTQLVPRQWAGRGLNVRPDFLDTINRLARVGEAIALKGEVGFKFYLQPEPNPKVAQTELELDGQVLKYQNGPQDWRLMSWPGPSTAPQLRVQALVQAPAAAPAEGNTASNGTAATVQMAQYQRGPWALMRALAAAQIERLDGGRARVSWPTSGGQTVSYLMRNEASYGPQDLALIYGLKLPGQILQLQSQAAAAAPSTGTSPLPPPAKGAAVQKTAAERETQLQSRQALLQRVNQGLAQPQGGGIANAEGRPSP
ncbi:type VI secretion protein IcmF/TssM N-terminal domain-containing protein [Roseateles koreensis]|uniref:Type VI secretion protein IcmF/TssM N-terminal domain-containing protein n=1 Tax=Roseateles koreensis TaxID=2987526 RepID=A0ABT5KT56_9BURK|nr:type VI secretion protein IcmF/TssM N-terminal domain-containing protein [Roseateles koreensis]MDC8786104.1 type VI secretion protein IcmF/TssM N-terminal domain-containing protein [Roseateles koreensis]